MRTFFTTLLLSLLLTSLFADESPPEEGLVLSSPEQLAAHSGNDFLIREVVSPLSGSPVLKQTDFLVRGAQNILLERVYQPPHIPASLHDKKKHTEDWDKYYLYDHHCRYYKGWQFFPHARLQVGLRSKEIRVCDPNGMTIDFYSTGLSTVLASNPYGISNIMGGIPSGKHDPRNILIRKEENGKKIIVQAPDGTQRIYRNGGVIDHSVNSYLCYLEKEILPNGKVLKYHYQNHQLSYIESLSPNEKYVYASIRISGSPGEGKCQFTSSSGDIATYEYEKRPINIKVKEKSKLGTHKKEINSFFPPILKAVSSPNYRHEHLEYSDQLFLNKYSGQNELFSCDYKVFSNEEHYRISELRFPIGKDGELQSIATMHYQSAIPGISDGMTTVKNKDGSKAIYRFGKDLLSRSIENYDQKGSLKLIKRFSWTENQWLEQVEFLDSQEKLLYKKSYEYDDFGNPILETISGNLTGTGVITQNSIKRTYSQDGRQPPPSRRA